MQRTAHPHLASSTAKHHQVKVVLHAGHNLLAHVGYFCQLQRGQAVAAPVQLRHGKLWAGSERVSGGCRRRRRRRRQTAAAADLQRALHPLNIQPNTLQITQQHAPITGGLHLVAGQRHVTEAVVHGGVMDLVLSIPSQLKCHNVVQARNHLALHRHDAHKLEGALGIRCVVELLHRKLCVKERSQ